MAKTLVLQFDTEFGKTASISVDNPKEPIIELTAYLHTAALTNSYPFPHLK